MTMANRTHLEAVAREEMSAIFATVPQAKDFHSGNWMEREYYKRHLAETVLRIRLNNEVDAYALYKIGAKDNKLAATMARYLAEEYGHESMFLRDLEKFDITEASLNKMKPLVSTEQLIGYLYLSINRDGPLPSMIWNWFVEFYSNCYNKIITQKAAAIFGDEHVKGSMGHIAYDESHDHDDLMWAAVERAIAGWGDMEKAETYLRAFIRMIGTYFDELRVSTVPGVQVATT